MNIFLLMVRTKQLQSKLVVAMRVHSTLCYLWIPRKCIACGLTNRLRSFTVCGWCSLHGCLLVPLRKVLFNKEINEKRIHSYYCHYLPRTTYKTSLVFLLGINLNNLLFIDLLLLLLYWPIYLHSCKQYGVGENKIVISC